mmetsp:Transcript_13235/g.39038  ORF Transcript_13235/g.39038 Transcript_13235/m.39038 type:complete len:125 (-) Transcript_13235:146-520(-)
MSYRPSATASRHVSADRRSIGWRGRAPMDPIRSAHAHAHMCMHMHTYMYMHNMCMHMHMSLPLLAQVELGVGRQLGEHRGGVGAPLEAAVPVEEGRKRVGPKAEAEALVERDRGRVGGAHVEGE